MGALPASEVSLDAFTSLQISMDEKCNKRHHKGQTNEYIPYLVKSFDLI